MYDLCANLKPAKMESYKDHFKCEVLLKLEIAQIRQERRSKKNINKKTKKKNYCIKLN